MSTITISPALLDPQIEIFQEDDSDNAADRTLSLI